MKVKHTGTGTTEARVNEIGIPAALARTLGTLALAVGFAGCNPESPAAPTPEPVSVEVDIHATSLGTALLGSILVEDTANGARAHASHRILRGSRLVSTGSTFT